METKYISLKLAVWLFLLQISIAHTNKIIWNEVISPERLQSRIGVFNDWYSKFNSNNPKVEAKMTEDPEYLRIGTYAKEDIKAEDIYMKIERKHMFSHEGIYDTKLGSLIRQIEAEFGFDDYFNLVFYLLHEMNNPDSKWKPYLDLLPRQPTSIAFKYWERKTWIEEELVNTPILSKILLLFIFFIRKNCGL
jgi:hypothetical protein